MKTDQPKTSTSDTARKTQKIIIGIALVLVLAIAGIFLWYNSAANLVSRARSAYEQGETEKAVALLNRAEAKGKTVSAWKTLYEIYKNAPDSEPGGKYLKLLADNDIEFYPMEYGLHLARIGRDAEEYIPYLEASYAKEVIPDEVKKEFGRAAYILGNYHYSKGKITASRTIWDEDYGSSPKNEYWAKAAECGCKEANARLGDFVLCHLRQIDEALAYYKKAPQNMPGVKERIEIVTSILASNPQNWQEGATRNCFNNCHFAYSGNKADWGSVVLGEDRIYVKLERDRRAYTDWGRSGIPVSPGIWIRNIDQRHQVLGNEGIYDIYVGEVLFGSDVWRLGETIRTDSSGNIITASGVYPATTFWED